MRIVHVTNSGNASTLGIERVVAYLAVAQKERGSDVMIVIDRRGVFTETCEEYGIPVTVNGGLNPEGKLGGMPEEQVVRDLIKNLESFNADLVHCHSAPAAWAGIAAGNRANIPCFFTGDGAVPILSGKRKGLRFSTICITAGSFEELKSKMPGVSAYYVPNGTRAVPSVQAPGATAAHSIGLTFAGSLVRRKGIDIAILAMVELRRRLGHDCPILNIYGDGDQKAQLTEMTTVLELNAVVRFHGFKLGALEQCPSTDILVMPSRGEASPLVVLEAMSRGMPIVATDVGDVTRMLPDQRYGRVVPPESVVALADAIESLLADIASGQFDPDLLIERHRSLYSVEKWAERMEAAYSQVLRNSSAAVQRGRQL
jgi:glycosyltransferase involved in cell wall biosynthesis